MSPDTCLQLDEAVSSRKELATAGDKELHLRTRTLLAPLAHLMALAVRRLQGRQEDWVTARLGHLREEAETLRQEQPQLVGSRTLRWGGGFDGPDGLGAQV